MWQSWIAPSMAGQYIVHWADILVSSLVLLISLGVGILLICIGKKKRTTSDFLMGSHQLHALPVALSIFMSYISGITVLGMTAEVYLYGTQVLVYIVSHTVACFFAAFIIVPVLYPLQIVSSYQVSDLWIKILLRNCVSNVLIEIFNWYA